MSFVNLAYINCALDKHSDTNTIHRFYRNLWHILMFDMCFIAVLKGEGGIMKKKATER